MNEQREAELLRHIPTLACLEEAEAFRLAIIGRGEQFTGPLFKALIERKDVLARREKPTAKTIGSNR